MYSYYGSSYSSGPGAGSFLLLLIPLALGILMLVSQWRLFTKAGEEGWKTLIPVYNACIWYKITWETSVFWKFLGGGAAFGALAGILTFASSLGTGSLSIAPSLMYILGLTYVIAVLAFAIKAQLCAARSYGKGGAFAAGLIFLPVIFFPVLAFGDSQYIGPNGSGASAEGFAEENGENAPGDPAAPQSALKQDSAALSSKMIWVVVCALALFLISGFAPRFIMAIKSYRLRDGLLGSETVGFRWFQLLLESPALSRIVLNSAIFGAATLAVSLLFSLLGGAAAASQGRLGRALLAAFGAVIAFVPTIAWESILIALHLTGEGGGFNLLIPLVHALPVGGAAMMLGALLPGLWPQNRFSGVLIAPLLALSFFFFDRSYIGTLLSNPLNRQYTETIVSHLYQTSFLSFQLSYGAAGELFQSAINLIPALIGALAVGMLVKKSAKAAAAPGKRDVRASAAGGVLALVCMLAGGLALLSLYPAVIREDSVQNAALVSLLTGLATAILAFCVYFIALLCARRFDSRHWLPLSLLILLCVPFDRLSVIDYLAARDLGFLNTVVMPVLHSVANPLSIMLLLGAVILRPQRTSSCASFALGAALLSAAYVAGDASSSLLYLSDRSQWNLGMLLRNTGMSGSAALPEIAGSQAAANISASLTGAMLVLAAIPAGLGAALYINAAQREI